MDEEVEKKIQVCRHRHCLHGSYKKRAEFVGTGGQRYRHELIIDEHPCYDSGDCETCLLLGPKMSSKSRHGNGMNLFRCQHTGCQKTYSSENARRRHETEAYHDPNSCGDTCYRCDALQKNAEKQKRKEKCAQCTEQKERARNQSIKILDAVSASLKKGDKLPPSKDWQKNFIQGEQDQLLVIEKPCVANDNKVGIIPLKTLERVYQQWWSQQTGNPPSIETPLNPVTMAGTVWLTN